MNCLGCGACCTTDKDVFYLYLTEQDFAHCPEWFLRDVKYYAKEGVLTLPPSSEAPSVNFGSGRKCAALRGTVGVDARCAIYENRPMICARYEPGKEHCLRARERCNVNG